MELPARIADVVADRRRARGALAALTRYDPGMRFRLGADLGIAALLLLATLSVYAPVRHHDFVNYDDFDYVTDNRHVRSGLNAESLRWAFTSTDAGNWFPLTWISHMADYAWFGLNAGGHHVTSAVLHAFSVVLVYFVFVAMTPARWPSALVAFLFALHPQHVESVAWASERKDVLSGLFWFLTMLVYVRYALQPSRLRYALVVVIFALALMTKSMVVTLPAILLLLDIWPLRRVDVRTRRLFLEKVPLLLLAGAVSLVTFVAQRGAGAVSSLDFVPLPTRAGNAITSVMFYLRDMVWPARLAVFYPYPETIVIWQVFAAGLLIAAISWAAWRVRARQPWLTVGWTWFLVSLLPVIGLIQVGAQSRADRYTYLPSVGIFIMLAWGLRDLWGRSPRLRPLIVAASAAGCVSATVLTAQQIGYWRNTLTLFEHAVAVTDRNALAHNNVGIALKQAGRLDDARREFETAIQIKPRYADAISNLGSVYLSLNQPAQALVLLEAARAIDPSHAVAGVNLGTALARVGRFADAVQAFRASIQQRPNNPKAHAGLGLALAGQGRMEEGLMELREAARLDPADAETQYGLGQLSAATGRVDDARAYFMEATRLSPNMAEAYLNLGGVLVAQNHLPEAVAAFRTAVRLQPSSARAHSNLGGALAQVGDLDAAIAEFRIALQLAPDSAEVQRNLDLAIKMRGGR
jgi:Flp pilus assembly protein TadD